MPTGLWNLKDIQNLCQNRSKNKLDHENLVTQAHGVARSGYGLLVLCYPVDSELEIYPVDSYERFNNCEAWMIPTQVG